MFNVEKVWVGVSREFDIQPVAIAWTSVRQLRHQKMQLVRAAGQKDRFKEQTWETEEFMRKDYQYVLEMANKNFEEKIPNKEGRDVEPASELKGLTQNLNYWPVASHASHAFIDEFIFFILIYHA